MAGQKQNSRNAKRSAPPVAPPAAPDASCPAATILRQGGGGQAGRLAVSRKIPLRELAERTLHELQIHQVELEMQNEELRLAQADLGAAQAELNAARARYFDLYDLAPVGYCTLSEQGVVREANLTAATMLGMTREALVKKPVSRFILKEDQDIYYLHRKQLFETGRPQACELRMIKKDGASFWARLTATVVQDPDGTSVCRVVLSDITERKLQENEYELTAHLIVLVNTPGDFRERLSSLTSSLQGWSECEAVGIRLRDGDDYPYYETRGFPSGFVQAESHLCARGRKGQILCDTTGRPILECMCGNILCGRFDPDKPFFTARGSFWTNSTTALLANTSELDQQARRRNRCNIEGYESVALIPLRTGGQVFGLLQFNDHRLNRFTPVRIAQFERMADSLAIALSRRQATEELRQREVELRAVLDATADGILAIDNCGKVISANRRFVELWGIPPAVMDSGEDRQLLAVALRQLSEPEAFLRKVQWLYGAREEDTDTLRFKDGRIIERRSVPLIKADALVGRVWSFLDVTERKRADEILKDYHAELEQKVVERTAVVKERTRQLHALDRQLIHAEEAERQRIAHVLHEEVQQVLVAARMTLQAGIRKVADAAPLASLRRVDQMLLEALAETRELVHMIVPPGLREGGLQEVIRRLAKQMRAKYGFSISVTVDKRIPALDDAVSICVYHAVREMLLNIYKHANIKRARVIFQMLDNGWLKLTVQDRGVGFLPDEAAHATDAEFGGGLSCIRERIEGFGGRMEIVSGGGRGTSISLILPVQGQG